MHEQDFDEVAERGRYTVSTLRKGDKHKGEVLRSGETKTGEKKRYLLLHPDLGDGDHRSLHRVDSEHAAGVLGEMLGEWQDYAEPGDEITIKLVEMTDAEFEAVPES